MKAVGETIGSRAEFDELPAGAEVRNRVAGDIWTKQAGGDWRRNDTGARSSTLRTDNHLVVHSLPAAVRYVPGYHPVSQAEYEELPVGTTVRTGSGRVWTKQGDGIWVRDDGTHASRRTYLTAGGNVILSIPTVPLLPVGTRLTTQAMFDDLPVGTIIEAGSTRYEKVTPVMGEYPNTGWWVVNGSGTRVREQPQFSISDGVNCIVSYPTSAQAATHESVNQYKWKFRQHVITAAQEHFGDVSSAIAVLDRLGVTLDTMPVGTDVYIANNADAEALPEGTVVYHGDPASVDRLGVFVRRGNRWVHVLGERVDFRLPVTVDTVAGKVVEVDWNKPATEPDEAAINQFKGLAWREGWVEKKARSWCGTYEEVMRRIGIDASYERHLWVTSTGIRAGEMVTPEQAATLPVGSILKYQRPAEPNAWAYYMRTERANPNRAGTRAVVRHGGTGGHFSTSGMMLEWAPEFGEMRLAPPDVDDLFEVLPVGTVFDQAGSEYVLCENRQASQGRQPRPNGQYRYHQFNHPLAITFLPVPA